jgi:JAB domain-containing protein similar to deubiquitination enzymes
LHSLRRTQKTVAGWIAEEAKVLLIRASVGSHPLETGGILAGVLVNGRPWVTHAKEIPSQTPNHTTYVLPAGETSNAIEVLRRSDSRVGYLGDWHSHPADVGASQLDLRTLKLSAINGDVRAPLLVIVRRQTAEGYVIEAHEWSSKGPRRLKFADSGPLPHGGSHEPTRLRRGTRRG